MAFDIVSIIFIFLFGWGVMYFAGMFALESDKALLNRNKKIPENYWIEVCVHGQPVLIVTFDNLMAMTDFHGGVLHPLGDIQQDGRALKSFAENNITMTIRGK